ncbi:MAG TPA: nitroreductase [Actinobacteria bacterium]|nr:nitroreductase [Actinomycetota bacterium]
MDADEVLTTTRAVRKRIDLDRAVPLTLIADCIEIALQAPSGGNRQGWHFVVVTDADKRRRIAELYRQAWAQYLATQRWEYDAHDPRQKRIGAVISSAQYLADHLHEVPVHVIPCIEGRLENLPFAAVAARLGSIFPAAWSFMLAARARGLGSSFTTLHLQYEREAAEVLGIPAGVSQCALLPVGYLVGDTLRPAQRLPVEQVAYLDNWGNPLSVKKPQPD